MKIRAVLLGSILLFIGCTSIHTQEYEDGIAETRAYLMKLTGDRFDEVIDDNDLYPLFNPNATYHDTVLAARRAIRWRIDIAGGQVESGAINLSMILSSLLGRKPQVEGDPSGS